MKFWALNVDFNSASFDPLSSRSPPYECIKFGYHLENVRFLLLSTNLARERLPIDTDLVRIITSTADELSGDTNFDDLERPWTPKIWVLSKFFAILGCDAHLEWIFAEMYIGDRPRQPAYEIKLMLSRVSWAVAQISYLICAPVIQSNYKHRNPVLMGCFKPLNVLFKKILHY